MSKKKRFLIYDFHLPHLLKDINYPIGGATVEAFALAEGLLDLGHRVGALVWQGAKKYIGDTSVDIVECYDPKIGVPKIRWLTYRYPSMLKAARSYSPDYLVQKTAGLPTGITALLARKLKLPFIYWVENDIEVDNRLVKTIPYYALRMFNFGIKNADYIMTQNEYQYKTLRKVYPNRVFLVHNPFYPLGKTEARQQRNYVAWIGVYKNQKNLPALYHIARQTAEVTFKIAGIEPAEGVDVDTKKALRLLRLCPNVKFVGYLDRTKIMNFLGGAFALLNTSDYEGFSNTFLEAFSAGTPVVSLNSDPNGILKKYNLGYPINLENASIVIKDYFHEYDHNAFMKRGKRYLDMFHDYNNVSKKFLKVLNSN